MTDTPTKTKMNIVLLNIPIAIVAIAIAIVPLVVGMKHQDRVESNEVAVTRLEAFRIEPQVKELEHAA